MPDRNLPIALIIAAVVSFCIPAQAVDYTQLSAVKRLRAEKRYDEALQKVEAMAAKTDELGDNYSYLTLAIDIAVDSLKDTDRALALATAVKDPGLRDFAKLRVLTDFQRYDEALAFVKDKDIESWSVRCRGQAHGMLAEIYHKKKDDAAELEQWLLSSAAPGAEITVRGRAFRESGVLFQKQGNAAKAEAQFRQALEVTPANYAWRVECLMALSRMLVEQQRTKEAVKVFEGVDFDHVTSVTARGNLLEAYARTLLAAGRKIRAIETYDQLLQLDLPAAWKDRINKQLDQMAEEF